ncbi:hypothetical protein FKM82_022130 [Ascaphus truei]
MRTHLLCCPVCNNPPTRRFQGQTRSPEKGMPNPESPGETRRGGNPANDPWTRLDLEIDNPLASGSKGDTFLLLYTKGDTILM